MARIKVKQFVNYLDELTSRRWLRVILRTLCGGVQVTYPSPGFEVDCSVHIYPITELSGKGKK
jgi:hypothetical protein